MKVSVEISINKFDKLIEFEKKAVDMNFIKDEGNYCFTMISPQSYPEIVLNIKLHRNEAIRLLTEMENKLKGKYEKD